MKTKAKLLAMFKIWLVIYPSITLLLFFTGTQLAACPLVIRTLILTIVLVPWMILAGLPMLEAIIKLFPAKRR